MRPSRRDTVLDATKRWRDELFDTTGRNPLRNYRDLKVGTLDLTPGAASSADAQALDRLLADRPTRLSDLFPVRSSASEGYETARRRLVAIHKKTLANLEEKGISTLFAAIGLVTWKVDQGSKPNAPMILLPLEAAPSDATATDFKIRVAGDAHLNPVLAHILRTENGIETEEDTEETLSTSLAGFHEQLERLRKSWNALPELTVLTRVVAGNFSYATMPLVKDLEEHGELFATNDLVAAIAGDVSAREALSAHVREPEPNRPDHDSPSDEFLVLDADSSQHAAINRAVAGESLVVQGPPGTGKSQTIANLITTLVARGKRVLFVAEKRAAIEAVTKRLNQVGLSSLVMDMHGGVTSRRDFARGLKDSLERVRAIPAYDDSGLSDRLMERREALREHSAAVHDLRDPWKLSVYQMRVRLLECAKLIPVGCHAGLLLSPEMARALDHRTIEPFLREIKEWTDLGGHKLADDHPAWARSSIDTRESAREALDLARELDASRLSAARAAVVDAITELELATPETAAGWKRLADLLMSVAELLERHTADVYHLDHTDLIAKLAPAKRSPWSRAWARLLSRRYRAGRRAAQQTLAHAGVELTAAAALDAMEAAYRHVEEWKRLAGTAEPRTPGNLQNLRATVDSLEDRLNLLRDIAGIEHLAEMPHQALAATLRKLVSDQAVVARLPRIRQLEARFRNARTMPVLERVGESIPPEYAAEAVEYAWLRRILEDVDFDDRRLHSFDGTAHSRHRNEFVAYDRRHLQETPQRVQRLLAESIIQTMDAHGEETALIRREAAKSRRHLTIRRLFAQAPHVLTAIRPCWTMSPILVSEMVPPDQELFDVVLFDEASQVPPAEAMGSLARARQAVIAGDSRQLPPTSFFGSSLNDYDRDEGDGQQDLIEGIESLLDASDALLPSATLSWHYRSRDDRLIAFSNNHIYGGNLTAFPGTDSAPPISHCLVPYRPIVSGGGTRSNPDEVAKVVDLIIEHARVSPSESLGVIAFGQRHADNIENELHRRLRSEDDHFDEFFSESQEERFFVKNIERVQGDERDVIILSVGYHKDADGRLPYRFGPLLQEGGERRLNVAVTRARSRVTLVSSFSHRDMDPGHTSAKGVQLLRQYIEFAASGGHDLGADVVEEPLNAFELDVRDGLERYGIPVTPQYGASGFRIDFACAHPDKPGKMILAIEADGAQYHSSPTTRDRDRLRQQILEDKGWRFHRIWSTAWFRDRDAELERAHMAWRGAVRRAASEENMRNSEQTESRRSASSAKAAPEPRVAPSILRPVRPSVPPKGTRGYEKITDYRPDQLVALARWIESDTLLRTEDDLLAEMMSELGFRRRGKLIEDALTGAIARARRSG